MNVMLTNLSCNKIGCFLIFKKSMWLFRAHVHFFSFCEDESLVEFYTNVQSINTRCLCSDLASLFFI